MKNFTLSLIIAIILSLLLTVCNDDETAQLRNRNRLLNLQTQSKDSVVQDFMVFFNAFEGNLNHIMEKENLISLQTTDPELLPDQKEKILTDIQIINDLLDHNQYLIKQLHKQVANSNGTLTQYQSLLDSLQTDLYHRFHENKLMQKVIVDLNAQQNDQNQQIDSMELINQRLLSLSRVQAEVIADQESNIYQKTDTIRQQSEALKRGYYIVGTEKDLTEKNIIKKASSFLGIGRKYKVVPDLKKTDFTPVNILEFEGMWVVGNKARLASPHPSDSYFFHDLTDNNTRSLQITDSERFWSISKYLVVVFP